MDKGFTLIELLVVVLIIGILSSVALPQYQKAVNKSKAVEALGAMSHLEQAAKMSFLADGVINREIYREEVPALKHFQLGSYAGGDYADSFFSLKAVNNEIILYGHINGEKVHRYCTGKCKSYFTEGNCEDSALNGDAISTISAAKCQLM